MAYFRNMPRIFYVIFQNIQLYIYRGSVTKPKYGSMAYSKIFSFIYIYIYIYLFIYIKRHYRCSSLSHISPLSPHQASDCYFLFIYFFFVLSFCPLCPLLHLSSFLFFHSSFTSHLNWFFSLPLHSNFISSV